jgi:hypothetical protein
MFVTRGWFVLFLLLCLALGGCFAGAPPPPESTAEIALPASPTVEATRVANLPAHPLSIAALRSREYTGSDFVI